MKKINDYVFVINNENDFNKFNNERLHSYFRISCFLQAVPSKKFHELFDYITLQLEFLDSKNAVIDYRKLQNDFGINNDFVKIKKSADITNIDKNSLKFDFNKLTLPVKDAENICDRVLKNLIDAVTALSDPLRM